MTTKLLKTMDLLPGTPSKSEARVVQILEAAIRSYASLGMEETSFQHVSKACKVSRPLIHHYFPTKRDLFVAAVKYIRAHLQKHVVNAIQSHPEPKTQLKAYVAAHLDWVDENPAYAAVATLFFYYCAIDKKLKALNTQLVAMGHERITALLEAGVKQGVFAPMDASTKAKTLQLFLTGLIVSFITEAPEDKLRWRLRMLEESQKIID